MSTAAARCRRVPPTFSRWRDSPGWRPPGALARAGPRRSERAHRRFERLADVRRVRCGHARRRVDAPFVPVRTVSPDDRAAFAQVFPAPGHGRVIRLARRAVVHELDGGPDRGRAGSRARSRSAAARMAGWAAASACAAAGRCRGSTRAAPRSTACRSKTRLLYTGNPWFLAPSVRNFRHRERLPVRPRVRRGGRRRAPRAGAARYSAGPILSEIVPTPSMDPSMRSPATTGPTPSGVPV